MKLLKLKLKKYRNYDKLDIELSPNLNIFIGNNAQGKSNILESVFVLALTKSYMNIKDYYLIKDNEDFARIEGIFLDDKQVEKKFQVVITESSKKLKINRKEIKKYSEYISNIKVLIFSPYNVNFVKDGPGVRRKDINMVISQINNNYVKLLQNFNAILKKRNYFLKNVNRLNDYDRIFLDNLNEKFCSLAVDIIIKRKEFIQDINKYLDGINEEITGISNLKISYISNVSYNEDRNIMINNLLDKLNSNYDREKLYGMTLFGPHRDDFLFQLNGKDLSIYGSQGQIRAAILALKLSELMLFKEKDDNYPILLLDDIFSELDIEKRNRLVKYILDDVQTIITTTDINLIDNELVDKARIFSVSGGKVVYNHERGCKDEQ